MPQQGMSRRAFIVGAAQAFLLTLIAGRLFYLQIIMGRKYRKLARDNSVALRILLPVRGDITDAQGVLLAHNIDQYQLVVTPRYVPDMQKLLTTLPRLIKLTPEEWTNLQQLPQKSKYFGVQIKNNLSWKEVARLAFHKEDIQGAVVTPQSVRYYPFGSRLIHVLGYVGPPTKKQEKETPWLRTPGVAVGKINLEKTYDKVLTGKPGNMQEVMDARGNRVRLLSKTPPQKGKPLSLTVDFSVQNYLVSRLRRYRAASSVVMNLLTGKIIALASHPAVDPNIILKGVSGNVWEGWNKNPLKPFLNRAVGGAYPPGSSFKIVSGMAFLHENINPMETIFCPGYYDIGGRRFYCWKHKGHGIVNFQEALAQSCDVYYYRMAERIGIHPMDDMAAKFGYGKQPSLPLEGVIAGRIPSPSWKQDVFGVGWRTGDTLNTAIGQGYISVSPLQLTVATARLITGREIHPVLNNAKVSVFEELDFSKKDRSLVIRGLIDAVNAPHGTAIGSKVYRGWKFGGKTGTSQVMGNREELKHQDQIPWERRTHSVFTGFAPLPNPRYVFGTIIEHGGSGSGAAAHFSRDLVLFLETKGENLGT